MLLNKLSRPKGSLPLILICAVAFISAMLATSLLVNRGKTGFSGLPFEGFDFTVNSRNNASAGPDAGARIDLTRLKMRDGLSLANATHKSLIMLVTVDSKCGACKVASDEMRDIRNRIKPYDVEYHPISFTASITAPEASPDFFTYADSLGLNASAFLWAAGTGPPPENLFLMVLPSHILVNTEGVILRKWPGTDNSPRIRRRMANQIVADTLDEIKHRAGTK
jgi:hypothetical protein